MRIQSLAAITLVTPLLVLFTGCAGGSSASSTPTPTPAPAAVAPAISSITPVKTPAGSPATTLTVTGTGFTSSTAIQVNGVVESTAYVSATQLTATIPASQLVTGGMLSVIAVSGTLTSGSATSLEVDNPTPAITEIVPATFTTGTAATLVSVVGTGFAPGTVIQAGGTARSTDYINPTQVNVLLTTVDFATAGNLMLTAVNPAPGGGTSAAASYAVNNPQPGIPLLTPNTIVTGAATPATITASGARFLPTSVIQVGGSNRTTMYVSSTQLTFQLTAVDQATPANLPVTVTNPAPGGGISSASTLVVTAPSPTPVLTAAQPTQFIVGSGATTIAVYGTNLFDSTNFSVQSSATLFWNNTSLPISTYYYGQAGEYVVATVPSSLLATAGTVSITVNSPTSTPAVSNALKVTIGNPAVPTLTSISPAAGPLNTSATVTLSGTGFTPATIASFNGTPLTTTYLSPNQLTVVVPASSVTLPGNNSFTASTPAPGGGTSGAQLYTAYLPIVSNSMVYNPVNGLFYLSVPGSAGAPYANSVVSVDPATGAVGTPIFVGSEPNKLALTSDGKYLWVGVDGASAVRQINLLTNTAGTQFTLPPCVNCSGTSVDTALALAALPGASNSVVVSLNSTYYSPTIGIFDSGVLRGSLVPQNNNGAGASYAVVADGTRNEIYAGEGNAYQVFSYNTSGITLMTTNTLGSYSSSTSDEIQIAGGHLYTDFGKVYDPESGALLGSLYSTGSTYATGSTVADLTLGRVFVLDSATQYGSPNQIQAFNIGTYAPVVGAVIPVNLPNLASSYTNSGARLTRWGTNGLAFRTSYGVFSVRSNAVKDLSTTQADLSVTVVSSGSSATGANTTYTATVSNAGPSASTNLSLVGLLPASGVLVSATPSTGVCTATLPVVCNLGGLANGATVTIVFVVTQNAPGSVTFTAQVSGSEIDPASANNVATATSTITGVAYSPLPALVSISPAGIQSGSNDTVITATGSGFVSSSQLVVNGSALPTMVTGTTHLSATVPAATLANLGWVPVTVSTPAPGGGTAATVPLSIFSVITVGMNHILYDPYSRKIMASVGSGSSAVAGNSIVAITPETATVGTPVNIGSQPAALALTSDGQILYTVLAGSNSVARYNMSTQQPDFTVAFPPGSPYSPNNVQSLATQPGTENTVAISTSNNSSTSLYDFDPVAHTLTARTNGIGSYPATPCFQFLDANTLVTNVYSYNSSLERFTVGSSGLTALPASGASLNGFTCFKLSGKYAYGSGGGVADASTTPIQSLGNFAGLPQYYSNSSVNAPDASLGRVFFIVNTGSSNSSNVDGVGGFDQATFLQTTSVPLNMGAIEGFTNYAAVDLIRWGQDGLAALTNGGHLYLLRGAAVVPQLLTPNSAAALTDGPATPFTHGTGNVTVMLTGSGFVPGVVVMVNGSPRTTAIADATHLTVALPAADIAAAGTLSVVATNPNAAASNTLTLTVN